MQYVYQIFHTSTDTNGNARYAVVLYSAGSWETTRPDGKKVDAVTYLPKVVITGGTDLRDDARRWFVGTWGELGTVSSSVPETTNNVPKVHHRDVFQLFGEPAHVLIAQCGYPANM